MKNELSKLERKNVCYYYVVYFVYEELAMFFFWSDINDCQSKKSIEIIEKKNKCEEWECKKNKIANRQLVNAFLFVVYSVFFICCLNDNDNRIFIFSFRIFFHSSAIPHREDFGERIICSDEK